VASVHRKVYVKCTLSVRKVYISVHKVYIMLTELVSVSGKFLEVLVRGKSKSEKCTVKPSIQRLVDGGVMAC